MPLSPATGSAAQTTARSIGSSPDQHEDRGSARARSPGRRARAPSRPTIRTPASGTPAARSVARDDARHRPPSFPDRPRLGADRLQHHLRGEVVAVVIHELDDLRRAAASRSSRPSSPPARPCPVPGAAHRRSPRAAGARSNRRRGRERRVGDEAAVAHGAVDDERGERRRLAPGEPGSQPGRDRSARRSTRRRRRSPPVTRRIPRPPEDVGQPLEVCPR